MTRPRTGTPGHHKACSCEACLAHRRVYDALRLLDNAVNGPRRLPVGPYRDAVRGHLDAGWASRHLAHLYGCTSRAVRDIAQGRTTIIRRSLARRIDAAAPTFANAPDGVHVPAYGVHRRIQALRALGWTGDILQPRVPVNVGSVMLVSRVHINTHRAVAAVYEDLAIQWGPSQITRDRARRAGYVPPAGWDDIDTDPEPPKADAHVATVDEVEWLASAGETLENAADRLGFNSPETLAKALYRWGRPDLVALLKHGEGVAA
jgi:hypothetical protein